MIQRAESALGCQLCGAAGAAAHLLARQLAALTGLRALRNLYLELVRVHQELGRHSKPPARNLQSDVIYWCCKATSYVGAWVIYTIPAWTWCNARRCMVSTQLLLWLPASEKWQDSEPASDRCEVRSQSSCRKYKTG